MYVVIYKLKKLYIPEYNYRSYICTWPRPHQPKLLTYLPSLCAGITFAPIGQKDVHTVVID